MITVTLQGGLGNQMFQYALGLALQKRGKQVQYYAHNLAVGRTERAHDRYQPDYGLDKFCLNPLVFGLPSQPLFKGETVSYDPKVWDFKNGTLSGYWQSEKYFVGVEADISLAFQPRVDTLAPRIADVTSKIVAAGDYSIALQVRRGDYLQFKDFHGVMGKDYFREGVKATGKNPHPAGKTNLFIFTDDEEWCRENIPDGYIANTGSRHWDIHAMSICSNIVISNSSFGWWGAWLGDSLHYQGDRTVVAPKQWFATNTVSSKDIVPERWLRI